MANLKIGRIELPMEPSNWTISRQPDSQSYTFEGFIIGTSLATTQYFRNELMNQHGAMVPVVWDKDTWFNGYYYLMEIEVETLEASYLRFGAYPFRAGLYRVGGFASTELQSLITSGDRVNDFNTTPAPFHAPPVGTLAYDAGNQTAIEVVRATVDGNISTFHNIDTTHDPSWSVEPADYYKGGVYIYTDGVLRAGTEQPANDPTDWYMGNGLIEVRPVTYQSASNGRYEIRAWNGSAWSAWKAFRLTYQGQYVIPSWHYMTIVRNTAEAGVVKLIRDAATVPASAHRHTLDILLRRGAPYIECIYTYSGPPDRNQVGPHVATAASRPSTDSSYVYGSTTHDGHRWFLASVYNFTLNSTGSTGPTGNIWMDDDNRVMPYANGFVINNSTAATENVVGLVQSYAGPVAETVRAIRR